MALYLLILRLDPPEKSNHYRDIRSYRVWQPHGRVGNATPVKFYVHKWIAPTKPRPIHQDLCNRLNHKINVRNNEVTSRTHSKIHVQENQTYPEVLVQTTPLQIT